MSKRLGRPPYYTDPEVLSAKVDDYFEKGIPTRKIIINGKQQSVRTPTIMGLILYLGFNSRESFYDYGNKPAFMDTIKKAHMRISEVYEQNLHNSSCVGSIFALKNLGWKDTPVIDASQHKHLTVKVMIDDGSPDKITFKPSSDMESKRKIPV